MGWALDQYLRPVTCSVNERGSLLTLMTEPVTCCVYMFHAIWEFVQSRDCVAHSQNPEIAFQFRDKQKFAHVAAEFEFYH